MSNEVSNIMPNMDWDKFAFDYRLDLGNLFPNFVAIEAYKEAALNLVLPPDWRERLDRLNRVRAVYGTTALEGNPLSEAEVSHQMDIAEGEGRNGSGKVTKEQLQIRNAAIAQEWVRKRFSPNGAPPELSDILEMHRMVTQDSDIKDNAPGELRKAEVTVGSPDMGGVHKGAPYNELPKMMREYVAFINSKRLLESHPVVRALLAHFFLVTIHPFGDGNGRVSRLLEAGTLFQGRYNVYGFYGLSNYFYQNQRQYKVLLQKCRGQQPFEITPFVAFGIDGFSSELKGINNFIKAKLNRLVYRQMLHRAFNKRIGDRRKLLNQREWNLLDFLLIETEPADPFSENPSRKVRFSELKQSSYIQSAYRSVKPRTLYRELNRLGELGFIWFTRDEEAKDWNVELDFDAIGKY